MADTSDSKHSHSSFESSGDALPGSDMAEELFDALDDIAGVVLALRGADEHSSKAERLDQAGEQIVDALVREFSLRSAQVEVLLRETDHVDEAWGTYVQKVARRNEHLADSSNAMA